MNILIVSNLYPPHVLGGYEILCGQVCDALAGRGHTLSVLTTDHGLTPGAEKRGKVGDVEVDRSLSLYLPFDRPAALMRSVRRTVGRSNARLTARTIDRLRPDIVFIWSQLRLTLGPARAVEASGRPVCYTLNDDHLKGYLPARFSPSPRGALRWAADRFLYAETTLRGVKLARTTSISKRLRDNLTGQGVDVGDCRVIYQGIPVEKFPRKDAPGSPHSPLRLLYVGQLHDYKGVHTLVEAAHALAGPDHGLAVKLTVVGAGNHGYEDRLHALAAAGPAEVNFRGRVDHHLLPGLYREHDIFVFPSIWPEPFGLTHLEAMASGLTVVSTAGGGQGEFLEDGVNSLVFTEDDPAGLTDRLARLAADPELSLSLALAGREVAVGRFSVERYVTDLEAWLTEIAGVEQ